MEVFVIPLGGTRYALYSEAAAGADEAGDEPAVGLRGRLRHGFEVMLRAAEAQDAGEAPVEPGWWGRQKHRLLRWVAARVAEQRLLWRLRREARVMVAHPEDLDFEQVRALVDRELRRDRDRHRTGLGIFGVAFVLSGLVAVVPGPNMLAYYFAFRAVGHYLSLRGALHGLRVVEWRGRTCPELRGLREATGLGPADREARVRDVAYQLHLPHLPRFFTRAVTRPA
jgi:hypothetical protein